MPLTALTAQIILPTESLTFLDCDIEDIFTQIVGSRSPRADPPRGCLGFLSGYLGHGSHVPCLVGPAISRARPAGNKTQPEIMGHELQERILLRAWRYHEIHVESNIRVFVEGHHLGRRPGVNEWVSVACQEFHGGKISSLHHHRSTTTASSARLQ